MPWHHGPEQIQQRNLLKGIHIEYSKKKDDRFIRFLLYKNYKLIIICNYIVCIANKLKEYFFKLHWRINTKSWYTTKCIDIISIFFFSWKIFLTQSTCYMGKCQFSYKALGIKTWNIESYINIYIYIYIWKKYLL